MSGAVSGLNQAAAIQSARAVQAAHGAIAEKRLEAAEVIGEAVVQMIQQATDPSRSVDIRA